MQHRFVTGWRVNTKRYLIPRYSAVGQVWVLFHNWIGLVIPVTIERDKRFEAIRDDPQRVAWVWCIFFAFLIPEFGAWFRSTRMCVFKSWKRPLMTDLLVVFVFETCHVVGLSLLSFVVLPHLDVVKGAMLTNCVCFLPAVLGALSRHSGKDVDRSKRFSYCTKVILDLLAILMQVTGFLVWPWLESSRGGNTVIWCIPAATLLTSCRWWENFVDKKSPFMIVRRLGGVKERMKKTRYYVYMYVSFWKVLLFFGSMILLMNAVYGDDPGILFKHFKDSFGEHLVQIKEILPNGVDFIVPDLDRSSQPFSLDTKIKDSGRHATYTLIIHVISAWACYVFGKFACKICIQGFSYAFPVNLTIPITISLLIAACGLRNEDVCFAENVIPNHLFWDCPKGDFMNDFMSNQHVWIWLLWLLSQTWVTLHIWMPKAERLAATEKLFVAPMYCSLLIDQSLGLNRRRDDQGEVKTEDIPGIEDGIDEMAPYYETISVYTDTSGTETRKTKSSDHITRIYATATMWHETSEEMMEMLKSIFRMDEDQSARRVAQKYLKVVDPDYYEFETHILFDDAFELSDDVEDEVVINRFVKLLMSIIDDAASHVHQINVRLRPPKKFPTPYGGRLIWTLPGKTKIYCHLKDKAKIRHRKRWSQVMYMYYLLGHRLMELPISVDRKEVIAENTFLLTLDGDIDFQPTAVQLLVDLMKKNRNLGAACGRIHPVGSGPMQWYQKFEYAIGHWLQKSTEHMIGCVLCSPGCFSLFRAKALMDDNVMRKYTTRSESAQHYVQYDQGEDRWLCTLLLQRGYRVEYCAASDAYTHCPEGFNEFFNQRRRWVPSTMANIMDLLMDYKQTIKVNDNISLPYIIYQFMLMIGTVLGPGTIFLMLVGAFVAAFNIDNWTAFYCNMTPILFFILICFCLEAKWQLVVAQVFSAAYALVMMAVIVGTALQLGEDGIGSPSAAFLIAMSGSFITAALLHPQEFSCIFHGFLYLLSIPSMYLLLILYSLTNLNNVTWGTREVQTKKSKKELEQERKEEEEARKAQQHNALMSFIRRGEGNKEDGSFEFSFAGLFKIMCCTYPKQDDRQQLIRIAETLESITKRLDGIERVVDPNGLHMVRKRSISRSSARTIAAEPLGTVTEGHNEDICDDGLTDTESDRQSKPKIERDDLINPYWLEDSCLRRGEVDYLVGHEVAFWNDLLEKYLHPIDMSKEQKASVASELKELRNRSFFFFFMCNAIFILIVFLLQLNKDELHIQWPFGVKTNITIVGEEVFVHKEYLQLEPIGLVFVFFFALILIIQFTAMLFHRFGTISHILASTELTCCTRKSEEGSEDSFIDKNAVAIVKDLQRLRGIDGDYESETGSSDDRLGKRKTIHALERHRKKKREIGTLDVAFKKRFFSITGEKNETEGPGTPILSNMRRNGMRRETIKALLETRRNNVMEQDDRKGRMETLGAKKGEQVRMKLVEAGLNGGVSNQVFLETEGIERGSLQLQNLGSNNHRNSTARPSRSNRLNSPM